SQSNAPLRADAGAPTSGVIHVRTRLTADFTVISNALAQRRGSAVTVGVAAYTVVAANRVTVRAITDLGEAGETIEGIAYDYDMTPEQVDALCRAVVHLAA
uniref:DUF433 domain-containing protein n=1 Tax=Streptomyces adelaidensis TaxID=2796465 RepID=UPI0019055550